MSDAHTHTLSHGHDHHEDEHVSHGSFKSYMIGFVLSVILTAIPFWLVMERPLEATFNTHVPAALMLMGFAVLQMIVHMVFFLHMHPKSEGGWNLMALVFTLTVVVIVMAGSMWVMYHLNSNMMPTHDMQSLDTTGESYIPSRSPVSKNP